jgi:hypothetical protein
VPVWGTGAETVTSAGEFMGTDAETIGASLAFSHIEP